MDRRELLRAAGAATALALLPGDALAAWARVAEGTRPAAGLTDAQLALVGAIADTIIPRTDTPGATDVSVPAFVNVIVSEYDDPDDLPAFTAGLDAIDALARESAGSAFLDLSSEARGGVLDAIEALSSRRAEPARTYWRLKRLVVHGYFTSRQVATDVLHVQVVPGYFDGSAPMPPRSGSPARPGGHGAGHV